jgi:hypothetical protein
MSDLPLRWFRLREGKRVLVHVDLNVPVENGMVGDTTRIERVAPTTREIADQGGKVILLSHFGRPGGGPYCFILKGACRAGLDRRSKRQDRISLGTIFVTSTAVHIRDFSSGRSLASRANLPKGISAKQLLTKLEISFGFRQGAAEDDGGEFIGVSSKLNLTSTRGEKDFEATHPYRSGSRKNHVPRRAFNFKFYRRTT